MVRGALRTALSSIAGRHWIIALSCLEAMRGGMLIVGLPVKLDRLGWSDVELGLFAALGAVSYAVLCALYGLVVQRAPLRLLMTLSACLCTVVGLGLAALETKWMLYALCAAHALGASLFWPSLMAWIGESEDHHLVGDMAAFNCSWTVGLTAGFLLGGAAEAARQDLAIYVAATLSLSLVLLAPFAHIRGRAASEEMAPPGLLLPRRFLAAGWIAAFLVTLSVGVPEAIFVKLNRDLGYGPGFYGTLFGLRGGAQTAVLVAMAAFQGWRYRRWPLVACLVASAAGGMLVATAPGKGTLELGFVALGVGMAMGYSLGYYYSVHGRRNRKRNAGFFEALVASQAIVGGPLGGLLAMALGRRAPYAFVAAAVGLAAIAQFLLLRGVGERRGEPREEGGRC